MSQVIPIDKNKSLAERFWSIARGIERTAGHPDQIDHVGVVRHVLAVLDALARGEQGDGVSVNTLSFLRLLRESEINGDLSYASPEQLRGEQVDERSLVFSVGVLLFERLTGRHPFGAEGNSGRRVARIRKGELGSGVNFFPTVPAPLRSVLMRAMGPFAEERFGSLAELRARLELFVESTAPAPRLPGTRPKTPTGDVDLESYDQATRILPNASEFGRDLMAALDRHESGVQSRRRGASAPAPRATHERPATRQPTLPPPIPRAAPVAVAPTLPAPTHDDIDEDTGIVTEVQELPHDAATATWLPPDAPGRAMSSAMAEHLALSATASSARPRRAMAPLAWGGAGAAIATTLFLLLGRGGTGDQPGDVTPLAAAASVVPVEPEAEPELAPPAPPTPVFDREQGGEQAAALAAGCFSPHRLEAGVVVRIGVVFAPGEGARKIYFATDADMTPSERYCVHQKLIGLIPGAAPDSSTVVNYRLTLATGSTGYEIVE